MFVTKYTHSCVFVEDKGKTFLIDPGNYSVQNGLTSDLFQRLDYLLITHEHEDHMDLNFIKELIRKFPQLTIKTNKSVVDILRRNSITASSISDDVVRLMQAPHELLLDKESPENVAFIISNTFSHVGDSFRFADKTNIIAFPIQAPWGSYVDAIKKIKELSPQYVVPIHDWHWKDEARRVMQKRARNYLSDFGITCLVMEDGVRVEL